ncbi:substrate-binding domain-containing protein, partial [Serratia quinivorans]
RAACATQLCWKEAFKAILCLSEQIESVKSRLERLHAFNQTMAQHAGLVAEQAETPLNDVKQLEGVIHDFNARHRGMRKAVISANGAPTLQVARAMRRLGIQWGSDIGLLGFDELEWAELAGVGITILKQPTHQMVQ